MNVARRGLALAALAVALASPAAADNYALVVTGASGGEAYARKYDGWRGVRATAYSTSRER